MTSNVLKAVPMDRTISDQTIKRSYQLLSLLTVCEYCSEYIEEQEAFRTEGCGALSLVLGLAHDMAAEIHEELELSAK